MQVTFLGTGVAIPSANKAQSGLIVGHDKYAMQFDCGAGTYFNSHKTCFGASSIDHLFLTHLHVDHVNDLPALLKDRWISGVHQLSIGGPKGTKEHIEGVLRLFPYIDIDVQVTELEAETYTAGPYQLKTQIMAHGQSTCIGYTIAKDGKQVAIAGDTAPCRGVDALLEGPIDMLIHECSFIDTQKPDHTTPEELAELLQSKDVKRVCLTHMYPQTYAQRNQAANIIGQAYSGKVYVAEDLMEVRI